MDASIKISYVVFLIKFKDMFYSKKDENHIVCLTFPLI